MNTKLFNTLSLFLILTLTAKLFAQDDASPSISLVQTKGKTRYGNILESNEIELTMMDIIENDIVSIPTEEIQRIEKNLPDRSLRRVMGLSRYAAWRVASIANVGVIRGRVAFVDPSGYYVTLGSSQGLVSGMELTLRGDSSTITNPDTGKEIGKIRPDLGKLKILEVLSDELSRVAVKQVEKPVEIKRGMLVEWRSADKKIVVLPLKWEGKAVAGVGNEALTLQNELIDALIAGGATVISNAQLELTKSKLSAQMDVPPDEVPAISIAAGVSGNIVVTGTIVAKSARAADVRFRVLNTETANYLATVEGLISLDRLPPKEQLPMSKPTPRDVNFENSKINKNFVGIKFASIPPDEFTSPNGFEIGVFEVTQGEFNTVMGRNPSAMPKNASSPVNNVSFEDCVEFCRRLTMHPRSKVDGYVYRLPTFQEWWYATSANSTDDYFFGNDASELTDFAWIDENSGRQRLDPKITSGLFQEDPRKWALYIRQNGNAVKPVGQKKPNPWGLYDTLGNASEFVVDENGSVKLIGGSCQVNFFLCKTGHGGLGDVGGKDFPDRHPAFGFRVVRERK